jgi:hypothetical protein
MKPPGRPARREHALAVPTTFRGVASLARAPGWWLFFWHVATAAVSAAVVVWALDTTWGRALIHAAASLPDHGAVRNGILDWRAPSPAHLHQGSSLGIVIDPQGRRDTGLSADVTLCLEARGFAVKSLFGWIEGPYPPGADIPLSRLEVSGLIAAWRTPVLVALGVLIFAGLWTTWAAMATIYAAIIWVLTCVAGRTLPFRVAWRLAGAALVPAALIMSAAVALYATRQLGFPGLLLAVPGHILAGWLFCAGGWSKAIERPEPKNPFVEPRSNRPPATNPFEARS